MEIVKQVARLFGWKNQQFESLHEWNKDGFKIRVWRTCSSMEAASFERCADISKFLDLACANGNWFVSDVHAKLMAMPRVACVAIVDANGNGVSAYPDWH